LSQKYISATGGAGCVSQEKRLIARALGRKMGDEVSSTGTDRKNWRRGKKRKRGPKDVIRFSAQRGKILRARKKGKGGEQGYRGKKKEEEKKNIGTDGKKRSL